MGSVKWWMRITGIFYLAQATIAAIVRLPVRVLVPAGTLEAASGADPVARLLVDTWILFELEIAVVGEALILGYRAPEGRGRWYGSCSPGSSFEGSCTTSI